MIPAIIPARGGSKGIPGKNLARVCGRPLIGWTIEQARDAAMVDEVIVATDDDAIARMAKVYGARVFNRSPETATDNATSESVLREVVVAKYSDAKAIVFLQCTSPIRQTGDIDAAIQLLNDENAESVFSARRIHGYTWQRQGLLTEPCHDRRPMRQQDRIERIEENGSIYVFRPRCVIEHNSRHSENPVPYFMHPLDGYQIDEPQDIKTLEDLMRIRLPELQHRQWPI